MTEQAQEVQQEELRIYAVSTMYMHDEWYLHYAWAFLADSMEHAAEAAMEFFQRQQEGMYKQTGKAVRLISTNIVGGGLVLTERSDGKGGLHREIVPIGAANTTLPGPDKLKTSMAA